MQEGKTPSTLLEKLQALTSVERSLTEALEEAEPWLSSSTNTPVRPLPTSMDQVHQILAVARNLSGRTSAPAGWNPQAPVVGFATPNPLPHQLRGGALGTLQLERARAAQDSTSLKRKREIEEKELEKMQVEDEIVAMNVEEAKEARDPKRREVVQHEMELALKQEKDISASIQKAQKKQPPKQQVLTADMNLSDSSSSDDESD